MTTKLTRQPERDNRGRWGLPAAMGRTTRASARPPARDLQHDASAPREGRRDPMTASDMDRPFGTMPPAQTRALMASPDRFGTLNDFDLERLTYSAICLYGSAATRPRREGRLAILALRESGPASIASKHCTRPSWPRSGPER